MHHSRSNHSSVGRTSGCQMSSNGFTKDLVAFFKNARHLWGRCPHCGQPFRLSDAAISSSPDPPRDWLRRLQRQQAGLTEQEQVIANREFDLSSKEAELDQIEDDLSGLNIILNGMQRSAYGKSSRVDLGARLDSRCKQGCSAAFPGNPAWQVAGADGPRASASSLTTPATCARSVIRSITFCLTV